MTDDQLIKEWEETVIVATSPPLPRYSTDDLKRHRNAEAEILRRGFVRVGGSWQRPTD